jgi:hypothetical protein
MHIHRLIILGDSIINTSSNIKKGPIDHILDSILTRAHYEASKLREISFFHFLQTRNKQDDAMTNIAIIQKLGVLWVNKVQTSQGP